MKSRRWWLGPAILAAVLIAVRIGSIWITVNNQTSGSDRSESLTVVIVLLGIVALATWIPLAALLARGRSRDAAVRHLKPAALLVLGTRTEELIYSLRVVSPKARLRTFFVWAVDEAGASIWQGGSEPELVLTLDWNQIESAESFEMLSESARRFTAASFSIRSQGTTLRMPFLVRTRQHRVFPAGRQEVQKIVDQLRRLVPSSRK